MTRLRTITNDELINDLFHSRAFCAYDTYEPDAVGDELLDKSIERSRALGYAMKNDLRCVRHA